MKKQILVAGLFLAMLAGCSEDTSAPAFKRSERYQCAMGRNPHPNAAVRYCESDFKTPIAGNFTLTYKNKSDQTILEHYVDGYVVHIETRNASGEVLFRRLWTIKDGLNVV